MAIKRYADDYEVVITKDEEGHEKKIAVYHGDYFEFALLDEKSIVHFRRNCFLLLTAIIVLQIFGGFVGNRGMYQFYIAIPYVLAFFPLFYMAEGVLHLPKKKRKYRRDEIGLSFDRMKTTSIILIIFLGTGVLGEITFILFVSARNQSVLEYIYLALEALEATAVYLFISLQRQIRIQTCSEQ